MQFDLNFPSGSRPYLVTLRADEPSPFTPAPPRADEPEPKPNGQLTTQSALRKLGQRGDVGLPIDQSLEHRPRRYTSDVGHDRRQLDVGPCQPFGMRFCHFYALVCGPVAWTSGRAVARVARFQRTSAADPVGIAGWVVPEKAYPVAFKQRVLHRKERKEREGL